MCSRLSGYLGANLRSLGLLQIETSVCSRNSPRQCYIGLYSKHLRFSNGY